MTALGVAVVVMVVSADAAVAATSKRPSYFALGESFSAQSGDPIYNREPCERAPDTYPALVARRLDLSLTNRACSGASSADLLTVTQPGSTGPQVDEVGAAASEVTILIGLDDLGAAPFRFIGELSGCQAGNATAVTERSCQSLPGMDPASLESDLSTAGVDVAGSLAWLHRHRPGAKVLVLDYPAIIGTPACPSDEHLVPSDVVLYRSVLNQLNTVLRADASAAGDGFVDLYTPSLGPHGCPKWLTPPTATSVFPSHPTVAGEDAIATIVAQRLAAHGRRSGASPQARGAVSRVSVLTEVDRWP
jgi:hypothetical protein